MPSSANILLHTTFDNDVTIIMLLISVLILTESKRCWQNNNCEELYLSYKLSPYHCSGITGPIEIYLSIKTVTSVKALKTDKGLFEKINSLKESAIILSISMSNFISL